jgi:hypothetical protein
MAKLFSFLIVYRCAIGKKTGNFYDTAKNLE